MEKKNVVLTLLGSAVVSAVTAVVTTKIMERNRRPHPIILTGNLSSVLDGLAAMFDCHDGEDCADAEKKECDCPEGECNCEKTESEGE